MGLTSDPLKIVDRNLVLVHESVHDRFVERVAVLSKRVAGGDPLDERTTMGPMCFPGSFRQDPRAHRGRGRKGRVDRLRWWPPRAVSRTHRPHRGHLEHGHRPRRDLRPGDSNHAILLCRGGDRHRQRDPIGLQAAVFTASLQTAWQLAEAIDCGTVHVNGTTNHWELLAPFGGMKKSGIGRILGVASPASFTNQKQVTFDVAH